MTGEPTVLIVDDEPDVADTYSSALSGAYDVRTALTGKQALEILETDGDSVDVVLLDRRMPEMKGDEVLEEIQARGFDCRVVMVTAVDPDIDIVSMDFDEYLTKPVDSTQLREAVERMAARDSLDDQIQEIISVGSRLATLESKLSYEQLQESSEYATLQTEFKQMRDGADIPEDLNDSYIEATLENIEALLRENR